MASHVTFCCTRRRCALAVKQLGLLEKLAPASFVQVEKRQNSCFYNSTLKSCGSKIFLQTSRSISNRDKYNFFIHVIKETKPALVKVSRLANIPFFTVPLGAGSGFIVNPDGIIVTNAHVVGKSRYTGIRLHDGRKFEGKVLGLDLVRDIAILKIDAINLPTITMVKHHDVEVGEWVLAMGSPLSLKNTVTVGIVSNIHRAGRELGLEEAKSELGYIQTDATINVGNSGGPLLNLNGECVGMNTMMASVGIAFALPTVHVLDFMDKVRGHSSGYYNEVRRYLGVRMWTLTPEFIDQNKEQLTNLQNVHQGVYVMYVEPASPAAVAGIKVNDVIIAIDGEPVEVAEDVVNAVQTKDSFVMSVVNKNEQFDLIVDVEIENSIN